MNFSSNGISVPRAAGFLSSAVGLIVLIGWALDVPWIKSVLPGAVEMKANTAVGLLLAGVALWLLDQPQPAIRRRVGQTLSLVVALLGSATAAEYVFGLQFGIDQLLFRDTADSYNAIRGRMSPYSAIVFAVIGLGLAALPMSSLRRFVWVPALLVVMIGGVSFVGYLWNASELVTDIFLPPVAINTAVAFIMLGFGMLVAIRRPIDGGFVDMNVPSLVEIRKLARLVAIFGAVFLFCLSFYLREAHVIEKAMQVQERARVEALSQVFRYEIRPFANDLRQLAHGDGLHAFIAKGESTDLNRAIQQAAFFSRLNPIYDQIRFLNVQGQEILRVNQNGSVVPPDDLQDKSSRPYFQKALQLAPGQIYLSALDLNQENGQVEQPPMPVFRFSTPIFDQAGQRCGVYVINVRGSRLFTDLQELRPDLKHRLRLFNDEGYWLKASHPEQEWGFMFPEKRHLTLARTDPELWARIVSKPKGQSSHAGGVLTWQRIDLRQLVADAPDSVVTDKEYLFIASETSPQEFQALFATLRTVFSILTVFILSFVFVGDRFNNSRRQADIALRRSEENLAVTLHSIGDGVLATDSDGRVTRMNSAAEKLTGWTQAEAQGRSVGEVFRIINEETRQAADIPVDLVLATGKIQSLANHTTLIARDGREIPIADSAAPVRDKNDYILGVVLVFRDVTSERYEQERFKTVVEAAPSAMIMFDVTRRITLVNSQTEKIFGYARDELLGQRIELLTPERFRQEYVESVFASTQPRTMGVDPALYGLRKDGTEVPVEIGLSPVTTVEGVFVLASVIDISERKRTQDALRESEESLAVTLDSIGDGVLATDPDGRVTRLNRVAEKLTGWSEVDARGRPVEDIFRIINEHTREPTEIPIASVVLSGQIRELANHTILLARDGTERPIADSAAPIWNSQGQIAGVVLVFRDVTAARQARAEREQFFNRSHDLLGIAYTDGNFKRINPAFSRILGWTDAEFLSKPFLEFVHPDDRDATLREVGKLAAGQPPLHFENRCGCKDGSWRLIAWTCAPQPDGMLYASGRDTTELSRAEKALRDSEEYNRSIVESGRDCLTVLSLDGRLLDMAAPGRRIMCVADFEQIRNADWLSFWQGEDLESAETALAAARAGNTGRFEGLCSTMDGTPKWWDVVVTPILESNGNVGHLLCVSRDVTERRWAMEEVEQLNRNLKQSADQLAEANKELESFSYSVSHDLRAPLRHIQGYVEMLVKDGGNQLTEKSQRYLKVVSECAVEMGQLIDNLLEFSRMGRSELSEDRVSLDALTKQIISSLKTSTSDQTITWKVSQLPDVVGDRAMLRQVFANLLGNAVKYTRPRKIAEIEIGCLGVQEGYVVLFVCDNGVGFDMKYVHKLFGVFQRLHRVDEFEGTGIGLANVRRIVVRHGGRVWAKSTLNEGATFFFTLKPFAADSTPNRLER